MPSPSPDVREAAVTAALAEFERRAPEAPQAAPVVPFRPRPAYTRYLAVAAALVAVAGLGIVISQADLGGDDDDSADVENAPLAQTSARPDDLITAVDEGDAADSGAFAESAPADAADDSGGSDARDESTAEETAEEMAEAADGGTPAFGEDTVRIAVPADFDPDEPILNEFALAVYGSYLLGQIEVETVGPTPETECTGNYDILDTATYVLDGNDRSVYIAVNEFEGFVLALDIDTCTELAMGSLF